MTFLDQLMAMSNTMVINKFWGEDGYWVAYVNFNADRSCITGSNETPNESILLIPGARRRG